MLSSIFQHAWTLCIYLRQLGGQISITAGSQSLTPSQRPLLCCSSAAKRNQTSLFLRTTANCTTWDVVTTACTPTSDSYSSIVFEITNPGEDSCLRINDRWETTANQALNQSSLSDSVWQAQRRQASTRVWKLPRSFQLSSGLLFPQKTTGKDCSQQ